MNADTSLLPHDIDAENAVIASLLVDPLAMDILAEIVTETDFHLVQNRAAFAAVSSLWKRNEVINEITVASELRAINRADECDLAWLSRIVSELPTPVGSEYYAATVHRMKTYRNLITAGSRIVEMAYKAGTDIDGTLRQAEGLLHAVAGGTTQPGIVSIAEAGDRFWQAGSMFEASADFIVRSGLPSIDNLTGGFKSGNLVIVAARPGVGKSALLLNFARNAAKAQNARVAIVTLEMNADEWWVRMLARETGIETQRLQPGHMQVDDERRAMNATATLSALPIEIADASSQTPTTLRAAVRKCAAKLGGIDLVLVDYLQLMAGDSRRNYDNRNAEVTEISRSLKVLAGDLNVPVIAAAQLSREVEKRKPPIPILSDLRDSGSIEQDADVVAFMYQPAPKKGLAENHVKLIVAKNRNGPRGSAWLLMTPATSAFDEINMPEEPEQGTFTE